MDIKFHKRSGVISIQHLRVDGGIHRGSGSVATLHGDQASPGTLKLPLGVTARLRSFGAAQPNRSQIDAKSASQTHH